jgi:hypothetical protein
MKKIVMIMSLIISAAFLGGCDEGGDANDANKTKVVADAGVSIGDKLLNAANSTGKFFSDGYVATVTYLTPATADEKIAELVDLLFVKKEFVARRDEAILEAKIGADEAHWIRTHMAWPTVKGVYVSQLKTLLTEEEVDDLVDFYDSDTGRKWTTKQPALLASLQGQVDTDFGYMLGLYKLPTEESPAPITEEWVPSANSATGGVL